MTIEQVPLTRLHPAPWNPRTLSEEAFKSLLASLRADPDFLRLRPILAQADGTIYAGNQRFRAVEHLGHATVWAVLEDVPEDIAKARAIRDNISAGEWDQQALAEILSTMDGDLTELGFVENELAEILGSVGSVEKDGLPVPDACPTCGRAYTPAK